MEGARKGLASRGDQFLLWVRLAFPCFTLCCGPHSSPSCSGKPKLLSISRGATIVPRSSWLALQGPYPLFPHLSLEYSLQWFLSTPETPSSFLPSIFHSYFQKSPAHVHTVTRREAQIAIHVISTGGAIRANVHGRPGALVTWSH